MTATSTGSEIRVSHDDYRPMLDAVRERFEACGGPLFTTDGDPDVLWSLFLANLPLDERQGHTCHSCKSFVKRYGGLVTIDESGFLYPAMWGPAPGIYEQAFRALRDKVAAARVTGVFVSSEKTYGIPSNKDRAHDRRWYHLSVDAKEVFKSPLLSASQRSAQISEEYGMLQRGLAEFSADTVAQALAIAGSEALYRGEKVLGPLKWLAARHGERASLLSQRQREALTWRAVATAPAGFCHVKSSVAATLLEDVAAGLPFETVKRRFAEKLNPLQYRRPSAAPSDGAIAQAEKIVAALGSAGALRRRFARIEDIRALWKPVSPVVSPPEGVFGHLKQAARAPEHPVIVAPPMTWEKFARTVLPDAVAMSVHVPSHGPFLAFVTAADPSAPPILQWDREDDRNPVSWYVYSGGSSAAKWGLRAGLVKVTAISLLPFAWSAGDYGNHGAGAVFVLEGARDLEHTGSAIFPETLRSEYHGVRSVIEAYSRRGELEDRELATACGLDLRKGSRSVVKVRVTSSVGAVTDYTVDRWD